MSRGSRTDLEGAPTLHAADLRDAVQAGEVRVIDVRTPAEFETVHIPGAHNVPLGALEEHRDDLAPHLGDGVVLVCRSGTRATQAAQILAASGAEGLPVLEGGILAWEQAGGRVRRGRQRWALERQVRLVAGSLVLTSVALSFVARRAQVVAGAVGAGLTFAAVTDSCLMGNLLMRLPYNQQPGAQTGHDVPAVIDRLSAGAGGGPPR